MKGDPAWMQTHPGLPDAAAARVSRIAGQIEAALTAAAPAWMRLFTSKRDDLARQADLSELAAGILLLAGSGHAHEATLAAASRLAALLAAGYDPETGTLSWPPGTPRSIFRVPDLLRVARALVASGRLCGQPELIEGAFRLLVAIWARGREPRYGGVWEELAPPDSSGDPRNPAARTPTQPKSAVHLLGTHLQGLQTLLEVAEAAAEGEWRGRARDLSLLIAAWAFDPPSCSLALSFEPGRPVKDSPQANVKLRLRASWLLGRAARFCEEPGLEDVGRSLFVGSPVEPDVDLAVEDDPNAQLPREAPAESSAAFDRLAAAAHFLRRRPTADRVRTLEAAWRAVARDLERDLDPFQRPQVEILQRADALRHALTVLRTGS